MSNKKIYDKIKITGLLFCAFCCSLTIVYSTSRIPLLERNIINSILLGQDGKKQIGIFAFMYMLRAIFKLVRNHICAYTGNAVVNHLREHAVEKLIKMRGEQASTYEYSVLTNDLPVIADLLSSQTYVFAENLLILVLAIHNILHVSIVIGVVFIFGVVILLWVAISFISALQPTVEKIKDKTTKMTMRIKECTMLNRTIWIFDQQKSQEASLAEEVYGIASVQREQVVTDALWRGRIDFLSRTILVTSIAVGAFTIIYFDSDIGILVMVYTYSKTLTNVTVKIGEFIHFIVNSQESINRYRLLALEKEEPQIHEQRFTNIKPEIIRFIAENLTKNEVTVLNDVDISFKKGEFAIISGKSGSGKTVLADALAGFGNGKNVHILLDGESVVSKNLYWRILGYCQQVPLFFSTSIKNNITLWKENVDLQSIELFCNLGFIKELPNGYNTQVNSDNPFLSGGERQRVSMARVIANNPYVLILDDCLEAIDLVCRNEILQRLNEYKNERIIVLFTSDESLYRFADKVYHIEGKMLLNHSDGGKNV